MRNIGIFVAAKNSCVKEKCKFILHLVQSALDGVDYSKISLVNVSFSFRSFLFRKLFRKTMIGSKSEHWETLKIEKAVTFYWRTLFVVCLSKRKS